MPNLVSSKRELTFAALFLGIILSIVMGAANVYLGLRAGMTVSASIPAAVIAMGILHGIMRRKSLLESNMVQTGASAGESLAAGIIFTMPAMILAGIWETFDFWTTSLIALSGGLLGILFMIPMRRVFVVDSPELKYPEGLACAEVLRAGEGEEVDGKDVAGDESGAASTGAALVFGGVAIGAIFKFAQSFLGLLKSHVEWAGLAYNRVFFMGLDVSPALVSVGLIVGLHISIQIFLGGAIGWLLVIPLLTPDPTIESAIDQAYNLWSTQVRYIGVGTMAIGGAVSIWKVRNGLVAAVKELFHVIKGTTSSGSDAPEDANLPGNVILFLAALNIAIIFAVYFELLHHDIGITALITVIMIVMSFFFTAVASYIVGLVGNSNSPVSGMTITAILVTGALIYISGYTGVDGMIASLGVAGIVCCVACTSGDVCNDLKTGYILGAKPRNQQIMQILGVVVAAFIMAPVMTVLHEGSIINGTGGIGTRDLPAPQAVLFASLVNGFFGDGALPWDMVAYGVAIGGFLLVIDWFLEQNKSAFRLYLMPVAVGIYLPLGLSVPILIGGVIQSLLRGATAQDTDARQKRGILMASGLIAGESLVGVALGFLAYLEIKSFALGEPMGLFGLEMVSLIVLAGLLYWIYKVSMKTRSSAA